MTLFQKEHKKKLERIQRCVTKMIPRLRKKTYEKRLTELNLFPQTKGKLRGDFIAVLKIFKGYTNVNPDANFTVDQTNITKNNGYKIIGRHFETNKAKYLFSKWNGLTTLDRLDRSVAVCIPM